ncbi:helix-turn-helix domain-containing protein [Solicola sp. PLA-1-18]|uniref:helix-turn-helix domain-containing protein n=1 Tax=Solicola sp. PLA-1-18 TaxID=3380532 RepID=UPI003B7EB2A7
MARPSLTSWNPERLRMAREAKGWTTEQLAIHADLSGTAVHTYASGRHTPPPSALVALAAALEVPTTELAPPPDPPRLFDLRFHAGHSVESLAQALGMAASHTGVILRGSARITEPGKWADVLGVDEATVQKAWQASRRETADRHPQ